MRHLLAIDLVRFGCALLVLAHHYTALLPLVPPGFAAHAPISAALAPWTWAGWIGVELFFVVSGYVIAQSADSAPAAFLCRRVLRLAPAAWIAATLTTLIALTAAIDPPGLLLRRWVASMAFSPFAEQADPCYWTLGIEVSFYLLVAGLLCTRWRARALEPLAVVLASAGFLFWSLRGGWSAPAMDVRWIDLALVPHGAFFALGITLHAVAVRGCSPARVAVTAVAMAAGLCEIAAEARYMAAGLRLDASPALPIALFLAGVVVIAAAGRLQPRLAAHNGARLAFAGRMTYPLYLIHERAGMILIVALCSIGIGGWSAIAVATAAALAIAAAITARFEPAVRAWLALRLDAVSRPRGPAPDTPRSASPRAG